MRCELIKIGTSKGIRIPAILLKEMGNPNSFEIEFNKDKLVLVPQRHKKSRAGWAKAFQKMASNNDDKLVIDDAIDIDLDYLDEV